jgi:hypothetical protein
MNNDLDKTMPLAQAVQASPSTPAELKILRENCDPQRLILGPKG